MWGTKPWCDAVSLARMCRDTSTAGSATVSSRGYYA